MEKQQRAIILADKSNPEFVGQWTVGEVLQMAEILARWVQSLAVTAPPPPANRKNDTPPE